jgi:hypothetical protein
MGPLGDLSKGFIIYTVVAWILAIIGCLASGYWPIALLLLFVLMIALLTIAYGYSKNRKKRRI